LNRKLLSNSLLNVASGLSSAAYSVVLPIALASKLPPSSLSAWTIVMMPAAYTALFTAGIQSVIAQRVSHAVSTGDHGASHAVTRHASILMWMAAGVFCTCAALVSLTLPRIYSSIPEHLHPDAQWAFFIYAVGQSTAIPLAAITGYFFGIQNNVPVALHALGSRIAMIAAILLASSTQSLTRMSTVASTAAIVAAALLYGRYRARVQHHPAASPPAGEVAGSSSDILTLAKDCMPISIWAVATFLIYGGTSTIASLSDLPNFPAYTIGVGISLMLLGLQSAAFSTLIPHVAQIRQTTGPSQLPKVLEAAALASVVMSVSALVGVAWLGERVLTAVLSTIPAQRILDYLIPLLVGNAIRLIGLPYSNSLIGLGLQSKITSTPLVEAGVTIAAALLLGNRFGSTGVAWSLAFGGAASVAMHALVNMPATFEQLPLSRVRVLVLPLLAVGAVSLGVVALA
jgi:O-antigen/teichoic acid export membrane protein